MEFLDGRGGGCRLEAISGTQATCCIAIHHQGGTAMRFLMIARPQMLIPPEMLPQLLDGFGGWWERYRDKWDGGFFAGGGGGGGICTVADETEFNRMMMEWPLAAFSDIDARPL